MIHFLAIVLFVLITSFASKPMLAETVKFGTFDFPPYALHNDPEGRLGLFVDISNAITARAGISTTNSILPIARVVKDMERGVSDCAIIVQTPWTKENFLQVAEIHNRLDIIVVTRPGLSISSIEDLHGQRLAIPRGSFKNLPISTDSDIKQVPTNSYLQSLNMLRAGHVDAIAGSAISTFHIFSIENITRADIGVVFPFEQNSLWLQCAKGQLSKDVLTKLERATRALKLEGIFEDLVTRYIPPEFK
ncbi:hypothetical protein DL239_16810 [Sedimentitalea sp. CY04]|uniref:Solute-binding protein family 3/N-terminal domain-containing protein n=1 Tax=Parasedimentitalea denitrificans TaxID=2211118 RepID=A0ABX0WAD9_9RHOB|nr:transporter substrate-binding domain-containing protein [Sedimentitalea sp. CY04]NIZ62634.1 hypothetical protein [Sedimentitalea sp. CY04]